MTSYDTFAPFYDATMGDRHEATDLLLQAITSHHPTAKTVLELACGTGNVLVELTPRYTITGLDQSAAMLKVAAAKLPHTRLIQGDMSRLNLGETFDVILCIFDSINHLAAFSDWERMFARVNDHLPEHGLFIFDVITTGRIAKLGQLPPLVQTDGGTTIEMALSPVAKNGVDWHITVQQPKAGGVVQVYEDTARERAYPLTKITEALPKSLVLLETIDSYNDVATDDSDRVYFVVQKREIH